MSTTPIQDTVFTPVRVTVTPDAKPNTYNVSCEPNSVTITEKYSVIIYQLTSAPADVKFWSLNLTPGPANQFLPPEIGASGRMLTLGDADTEKVPGTFHVDLILTDPEGSVFLFDPQIINRPG